MFKSQRAKAKIKLERERENYICTVFMAIECYNCSILLLGYIIYLYMSLIWEARGGSSSTHCLLVLHSDAYNDWAGHNLGPGSSVKAFPVGGRNLNPHAITNASLGVGLGPDVESKHSEEGHGTLKCYSNYH